MLHEMLVFRSCVDVFLGYEGIAHAFSGAFQVRAAMGTSIRKVCGNISPWLIHFVEMVSVETSHMNLPMVCSNDTPRLFVCPALQDPTEAPRLISIYRLQELDKLGPSCIHTALTCLNVQARIAEQAQFWTSCGIKCCGKQRKLPGKKLKIGSTR